MKKLKRKIKKVTKPPNKVNVDKKLNEVNSLVITNNATDSNDVLSHTAISNVSDDVLKNVAFAYRPKALKKRKWKKGKGKGKGRKKNKFGKSSMVLNDTLRDEPYRKDDEPHKHGTDKGDEGHRSMPKISYRTYYKGTPVPHFPRPIVEEFMFS